MVKISREVKKALLNHEADFETLPINEALGKVIWDIFSMVGNPDFIDEVEDMINFFAETNPEIVNEIDESFVRELERIWDEPTFITVHNCPKIVNNPYLKTAFIAYESDNVEKIYLPNVEETHVPNYIVRSTNVNEIYLPKLKKLVDEDFHVVDPCETDNDFIKITTTYAVGPTINKAIELIRLREYVHINLNVQ